MKILSDEVKKIQKEMCRYTSGLGKCGSREECPDVGCKFADKYTDKICSLFPEPKGNDVEKVANLLNVSRDKVERLMAEIRIEVTLDEPKPTENIGYVGIVPKHCEKCGVEYTPIIYKDECPHDKAPVEPKPDKGRLLTVEDLPWLYDFTAVKANVDTILEMQDAKTASIITDFLEPYSELHEHKNIVDFVGVPYDKWQAITKE